ncbi:hypothetical protein Bca52824_069294 [Brassica carinata]|uniref:Uncharacterized protein n=1 Tax=Brassica carinata TaxID=52824 RepID=A0A8X7U0X1_BRACI|nr:hypothetical protein Bca52824_069294 [Brassica carinata]
MTSHLFSWRTGKASWFGGLYESLWVLVARQDLWFWLISASQSSGSRWHISSVVLLLLVVAVLFKEVVCKSLNLAMAAKRGVFAVIRIFSCQISRVFGVSGRETTPSACLSWRQVSMDLHTGFEPGSVKPRMLDGDPSVFNERVA